MVLSQTIPICSLIFLVKNNVDLCMNMKLKLSLCILIFLTGINITLTANEPVRFIPELAEWGTSGLVFYTAKWLDHQPVWSNRTISNKSTNMEFLKNTVSSLNLYAAAGVTTLGIGFIPNDNGWLDESAYHHSKGMVETLSATFLFTNVVKNIVGRKRPCFSNYPEDDIFDANKSFPSGHASIAFAIASYSSLYALDHFDGENKTGSWIYAIGSHALAAYVGYTRIADNRHFLSDVIAGGLLGSGVAWLIYDYQEKKLFDNDNANHVSKSVVPYFITVSIPF